VETGVGVLAFDADTVTGVPGLRLAAPGETLGQTELVEGEGAWPLSDGQIVLADENGAMAVLFGRTAPEHEVTKETRRALLLAVRVGGVPDITVEEALWLAAELVEGRVP
jgi:DNA/RNA-binding domain of Phe-tRNA-synthetase-like protein